MAKLYFRYGAVGSAKTMNLLAVAHTYRQQGKSVFLMKPQLDDRFGSEAIRSRTGLQQEADLVLGADTYIDRNRLKHTHCILVDEAQFLSPSVIDQLRIIANDLNIPVICYGLRTDFRTSLFDGARRLFELADAIEEVKMTCHFCNAKAVFNLKCTHGVPTLEGPTIDLGAEEKYLPACSRCYAKKLGNPKEKSGINPNAKNPWTSSQTPHAGL